jgi:hypothetical protein
VQGKGFYDPAKDTGSTNEGNTFWTDQMYVQYQIPVNPRKFRSDNYLGRSATIMMAGRVAREHRL